MKAIIRWSLWQRRRSTVFWALGVSFFIFINMIFYPSFKDQAAELQKSFENLPEAAVQLFGGSTDFFSPVGFMNSQIFFIMLPLLLGVLAISLGHKMLAEEEQQGTAELLLSRPVSRSQLLTAKAFTGIIILSAITIVSLLVTFITAEIVDLEIGFAEMALATLACFLLVLSFGAISFLFSALGKARALSIGVAAGVAIGGYVIASLSATVSWLEAPAKILPFNYYKSEEILSGTMDWTNLLYFVAVTTVLAAISWRVFNRRDIG